MRNLKILLEKLKEKYGQPTLLGNYLSEKYDMILSNKGEIIQEDIIYEPDYEDSEDTQYILFKYDKTYNLDSLEKLSYSFESIVKKNSEDRNENNSVINKLLEKYKRELENLTDYKNISNGEKVAEKLVKALQKTIIKLWNYNGYANILKEYLESNKIELEYYNVGHKMTNDELAMLNLNLINGFKKKTEDISKKYEVIEMVQPIIHIYFMDDDEETESKDIAGICKFYV